MKYKGYQANVSFDESLNAFHGRVVNTRDVITFQGTSVDELTGAFHEAVEDYLEFCASRGESPDKPLSGRLNLRVRPDLHREIAAAAISAGQSVNQVAVELLERGLAHGR